MRRLLGFGSGFLIAAATLAQVNTTSATAALVHWGQQVNTNLATSSQFWFKLATVPGRSYCAEVGNLTGLHTPINRSIPRFRYSDRMA